MPGIPDIPDIPDPSATESPHNHAAPVGAQLNVGVFEPLPEKSPPPDPEPEDDEPPTVPFQVAYPPSPKKPEPRLEPRAPREQAVAPSPPPEPDRVPSPSFPIEEEPPLSRLIAITVGLVALVTIVMVVAFGLALVFGLVVGVVTR